MTSSFAARASVRSESLKKPSPRLRPATWIEYLQRSAGNDAVQALLAHPPARGSDSHLNLPVQKAGNAAVRAVLADVVNGASGKGREPTVQRTWKIKYSLLGQTKHQQQAAEKARGHHKHFHKEVHNQAVGLRADVNGQKIGAGSSSGGRHAEDALIEQLHQLAIDAHVHRLGRPPVRTAALSTVLQPGNANSLVIRKLDTSPCTSTPRPTYVKALKQNAAGRWVRQAPYRNLQVITSKKTNGLEGCTERLLSLFNNGIRMGSTVYGFSAMSIQSAGLYQGGPNTDVTNAYRVAALEHRAASQAAVTDLTAAGINVVTAGPYIGEHKGR